MSNKPSHIPLFPDAYLRDTTHLTTEEHGAYFLLLMAAWGNADCSLPNDEKRLAALCKMPVARWRKISPTVLEFWTIDKGRLTQKRLLKEWSYVEQKRGKARAAASTRWAPENGCGRNANAYADGMHLGGGGGGGDNYIDTNPTKKRTYRGDGEFETGQVVSFAPNGGGK